jgi:hypothetical protein
MRAAGQRDRMAEVHQGLENMKLAGKGSKSGSGDSNGYQQGSVLQNSVSAEKKSFRINFQPPISD